MTRSPSSSSTASNVAKRIEAGIPSRPSPLHAAARARWKSRALQGSLLTPEMHPFKLAYVTSALSLGRATPGPVTIQNQLFSWFFWIAPRNQATSNRKVRRHSGHSCLCLTSASWAEVRRAKIAWLSWAEASRIDKWYTASSAAFRSLLSVANRRHPGAWGRVLMPT
jgi:hypothetical protein